MNQLPLFLYPGQAQAEQAKGLPFRGSNGDWRTYALPSADQFFV